MSRFKKTQLTRERLYAGLSELSKHIDCDVLVVIGSGAIAQLVEKTDDKAAKFSFTEDVDVCLTRGKKYPEKGEATFDKESQFHDNNGFYIQILDDHFYSKLESGWDDRATNFETENGKSFKILSPLDVASNKILVSRSKDLDAVSSMIKDDFINREELREIQNNLAVEKPNFAKSISIASEALDLRLDRSKKGFTEKLAAFLDKNQDGAKTFDIALGVLGIPLSGDNPTPPAMKTAEKHFDDKRIDGKALIEKLERFSPPATKRALARDKPKNQDKER